MATRTFVNRFCTTLRRRLDYHKHLLWLSMTMAFLQQQDQALGPHVHHLISQLNMMFQHHDERFFISRDYRDFLTKKQYPSKFQIGHHTVKIGLKSVICETRKTRLLKIVLTYHMTSLKLRKTIFRSSTIFLLVQNHIGQQKLSKMFSIREIMD